MAIKGGSAVIAAHFARNHDTFGHMTLRELADHYGCSVTMMRAALRRAESRLARDNLVICVPVRSNGYVVVVSSEEAEYAISILGRLMAIDTEVNRHRVNLRVVTGKPTTLLDDLAVAFEGAYDNVVTMVDIDLPS